MFRSRSGPYDPSERSGYEALASDVALWRLRRPDRPARDPRRGSMGVDPRRWLRRYMRANGLAHGQAGCKADDACVNSPARRHKYRSTAALDEKRRFAWEASV